MDRRTLHLYAHRCHFISCRWLAYSASECRAANTVESNAKWCEMTLGAVSAPASEAWGHSDSSEVYGGGLRWKRWMAQWNGVVSWNETMHWKSGILVCPCCSPKMSNLLQPCLLPSAGFSIDLRWKCLIFFKRKRFTLTALTKNNG